MEWVLPRDISSMDDLVRMGYYPQPTQEYNSQEDKRLAQFCGVLSIAVCSNFSYHLSSFSANMKNSIFR